MSGRQSSGASRADARASAPDVTVATGTPAPLLPTQAGHAISGPVPVVVPAPDPAPAPASGLAGAPADAPDRLAALPTPHAAPTPPTGVTQVAPGAPATDGTAPARSHTRHVVALLTAAAVLLTSGGVWAVQQERAERADARRAAQTRVDDVSTGLAAELAAPRSDGFTAGTAAVTALRAGAAAAGRAAVDGANATLQASAQAGDGPRGALQAAVGGAVGALDAPAVSLTTLRTTTAALAAPQQAVVDAQAAWQAAEDARIAAEAAAAQAAAAQAAAARAASRPAAKAPAARRAAPGAAGAGASAGAPAPAAAGVPMAGSEASAGDVGAALNAHRAENGLGALSIVRSGARVEHAMQMAASDSIWHSAARPEIVGRVSPGNATRMIAAYARSAGHNQQMLGSYSTAYIGAVSHDGWLYTSITFG